MQTIHPLDDSRSPPYQSLYLFEEQSMYFRLTQLQVLHPALQDDTHQQYFLRLHCTVKHNTLMGTVHDQLTHCHPMTHFG